MSSKRNTGIGWDPRRQERGQGLLDSVGYDVRVVKQEEGNKYIFVPSLLNKVRKA